MGLAVPANADPLADTDAAAAPVQWGACPPGSLDGVPPAELPQFSCATYTVPLDYQHPRRETISLALMRRTANKAGQRIGSLFLNPGGPGGPGFDLPTVGGFIFQPAVLDRFDLIGFDPRGVARSTPLRCFKTNEEANAVLSRITVVPVTRQQISDTVQASIDYSGFCARNAGDLLAHMSTADVVRDLDLLRRAVGDRKLNYVGFSYGTLIGATYANMFARSARAIVIDGNVDPRLRTNNGVEYDRERAQGFEISLDAYLKRCAVEGPKCAFSAGNPRAKFDEIRDRLRQGPIAVPGGGQITLDSFTSTVAGTLYSPSQLAPLAAALQGVYNILHPTSALTANTVDSLKVFSQTNKVATRDSRADTPYTSDDSYLGVNCTDKPFPRVPQLVPFIASSWERESPTFGRYQAFQDTLDCASWPLRHPDPYRGPWDRSTANPVLVIGNFFDPATQYKFSQRMARELGNARLLSVDSFGHTILGGSVCADTITTDYLINLKAPRPGVVCQPTRQPF
ncbi:alpha/beta hydrolase [Actinocrispum wychmicini]